MWARAKKDQDFEAFAPTLEKVIGFQRKFAGYRAKDGKKTYDIMLDDYEKGFSMENLDEFFGLLKKELVPFLKKVMEEGKKIEDGFLKGDYPEEKQEELARFLAGYVGFDFDCGVMAVSAHPFHPRTLDNVEGVFGKGRFDLVYGEREDKGIKKKPAPDGVWALYLFVESERERYLE